MPQKTEKINFRGTEDFHWSLKEEAAKRRIKGGVQGLIDIAIQFWLDCGTPGSDLSEEARKEIASIVRESQADKNSAPRGSKVRKSA